MRVLGLVPARGGSKGVPGKNIRLLHGKPLLAYTAEAALAAKALNRVILSTDDEKIAEVGRRCGLEVPFMRPAELARDETPMLPVVQHALREMEAAAGEFDAVCLLQPTTPLRRPAMIDDCIRLLCDSQVDSVMTVLPVPVEFNPHWVYLCDELGNLRLSTGDNSPISRRQDLPPAFRREGSVYVTRRHVIVNSHSLYGGSTRGYPIDPQQSVNIDGPADWERAERLVTQAG
jgi:CMP-N,N'-diacetyllegionaminic acid synthase